MRTLGVLGLLALLVVPAQGQMPQAAVGMPRQDPQLSVGTVTVRIVRGVMTEPIVGVSVVLTEEGKPPDTGRSVRTNNEGRAEFKDLPVGSRWVATANVDDKDLTSQTIVVPDQGGMRVLLTPVPLQMMGGAPAAGGAGDPPMAPKDMRARARGERTVPAGSLQLRVVHGEWRSPVVGHPIHLIGLAGDGEVISLVKPTGGDGRVRFDDLRPDATWYPLAVLPRGDTDDRLAGGGVSMPPRAGMTMVLTGEADPSAAPLDDLAEFIGDQTAGAGEVQLRVRGNERDLDEVEEVELIDALTGVPLAKAPAAAAKRLVVGQFLDKPIDKQDWPATRLAVGVARGSQKDARPAPGVRVELRPESGEPMVATSNDEGVAVFDNLVAGASYTPAVVQFGTSITGASFKTPEKNGEVLVAFIDWEDPVKTAGFRGLPGGNDHVYVVRAQAAGRVQLSQPFQLTRMRGALLPLELAPPPEFEFHIAGSIDDAQMSFQAQLTMTNGSAAPYTPAGGSAHMPLPRGARHVAVEDQWKDRVKVESGGLTWKGAVPPEGFQFNCSFTLPIEDGSLTLDMDVPQGAFDSSIAFEYRQGMQIATAGKAEGHTTSQQGRRFYVISDINVGSGQSLVLKVTGMPQQPAWRTWVRNAVGLGVLALLALGITGVFIGRRRGVEAGGSERDRLLDQLVDVERRFRDGTLAEAKYKKQRGRLTQRLEVLFGGTPGSAPPPPAED